MIFPCARLINGDALLTALALNAIFMDTGGHWLGESTEVALAGSRRQRLW
jgi:hypothetical protein